MVRHDVPGQFEPVRGDLVEHLPLPRDVRDDAVERRMPVGRDQNEPVALVVDIADLAGSFRAKEIKIGLAQDIHAVFRKAYSEKPLMCVGWATLSGIPTIAGCEGG